MWYTMVTTRAVEVWYTMLTTRAAEVWYTMVTIPLTDRSHCDGVEVSGARSDL